MLMKNKTSRLRKDDRATYLPHPQSCDKLTDPINITRRPSPDLPTPALPNMASLTSALLAMTGGGQDFLFRLRM